MKLNITTEALRKALARTSTLPGVLPSHLPTLYCTIEAEGFGATLRRVTPVATVKVTLEADIDEEGAATVVYESLVSAVNAMSGADTTIEADNKALRLRCGKSRAELQAIPAAEVLPVPDFGVSLWLRDFSAADLGKWLAVTAPAMADSAKPHLAGVTLRIMQNRIALIGVDGRRAHICYISPGGQTELVRPSDDKKTDLGTMMLADSVMALRKVLPETDAKATMALHNGAVRVTAADVEAYLPLSEQYPPDLTPVMPKPGEAQISAKCDRTELVRAVRTAAPLGFQDSRVISLKFGNGCLEVEANNQRGAMVDHAIDAEVTGGPFHLRATGQYVAEFLEGMEGETIELNLDRPRGMLYAYTEDRFFFLVCVRDDIGDKW